MSRLTDLINQARKTDPKLGAALAEELRDQANRRTFGLVFEQHQPENVELPGVPPQRGDKVHILPPRGEIAPTDHALWQVIKIKRAASPRTVILEGLRAGNDGTATPPERREVPLDDVIVVAETGDTIYPGLVQTGEVHNGPDDAPAHVVINAENSHALRMLTYTHAHSVDVIYIDPPYNTGAKDWKYNNDYVGSEDDYRHSKWLSFMQRRLDMAKQLLNPDDSVLIVTIDEKEVHRLGLLLGQTFPEARIQMVTSLITPQGNPRDKQFYRTDEYIYFVSIGKAHPKALPLDSEWRSGKEISKVKNINWPSLLRTGSARRREDRPNMFYPIFAKNTPNGPVVHSFGDPFYGDDLQSVQCPKGTVAIWPIGRDGELRRWQVSSSSAKKLLQEGFLRLGRWGGEKTAVQYLAKTNREDILSGLIQVQGRDYDGSYIVSSDHIPTIVPGTTWKISSHDATRGGTQLVRKFIPGRKFPFPKSLYAVEDAIRFFVSDNKQATVLDFFSGSGTTAHAVMRLNREDGGYRRSISITNNEVSADEQGELRQRELRPGDPEWETLGICDYVTKPRVTAAITGRTPDGSPVKGLYKFNDEFNMADGFDANARFFTLTYESETLVSQNYAFARIAPLLWLRAGQAGRVITDLGAPGWDIADTYAVVENLDDFEGFLRDLAAAGQESEALQTVFIVTDDDRRYQAAARRLDDLGLESCRLYSSYLTNYQFTNGNDQ
ncbi:site-specific DNA-methyltransferase [Corynebacterium variabile]|uniref:site-specific DNA-methyltransferase n=1 Tax=Corynebacterium variabile TaxID=1727 RepID=UPI00289C64C5|nr:DNA methyltransferase [Corynebacterium variabile]